MIVYVALLDVFGKELTYRGYCRQEAKVYLVDGVFCNTEPVSFPIIWLDNKGQLNGKEPPRINVGGFAVLNEKEDALSEAIDGGGLAQWFLGTEGTNVMFARGNLILTLKKKERRVSDERST